MMRCDIALNSLLPFNQPPRIPNVLDNMLPLVCFLVSGKLQRAGKVRRRLRRPSSIAVELNGLPVTG